MSEYIEREAAKKKHCEICMEECICYRSKSTCDDLKAFDSIPAADVRPVVLCRDCKYNRGTKTWIDNDVTADCTNGHGYPPLDWFCADGERPNCGAWMEES